MPSTTNTTSSTKTTPTSPQLLSPDSLETDLLTHLAQTTALEDLHTTLLSSLQRLGWTEKIRKLSLELLRAGRCERFDDVVEAVVASAAGMHPFSTSTSTSDNGSDDDEDLHVDVRVPKAVVEQGVRALKEVLRDVIVLDDDPDLTALQQSERAEKNGGSLEGEAEKEKEKEKEKGKDKDKDKERSKSSKNGPDPSPTKKMEKKVKAGKQVK